MKSIRQAIHLVVFLSCASFALVACTGESGGPGAGDDHEGHSHDEAKYGGVIVELAAPGDPDVGHVEMKLDHDIGVVNLWASLPDDSVMKFDETPILNFTTDAGPQRVEGKAAGNAWAFAHAALKGDVENARFRLKVGGKVYTPPLEHHH